MGLCLSGPMGTGRGQFQRGGDSVPSVSSSSDGVSVSGRKTLRDKEKHANLTDDGLSVGGGGFADLETSIHRRAAHPQPCPHSAFVTDFPQCILLKGTAREAPGVINLRGDGLDGKMLQMKRMDT